MLRLSLIWLKSRYQKFYTEKLEPTWQWLVGDAPGYGEDAHDISVDVKKGTHLFLALLVTLCLLFIIWASFSTLDIASIAQGTVFPSSQIKTVQHLEGGIVKEILVKEGQRVKAGETLVVLESTASGVNVQQLRLQIASLEFDIRRLKAELADFKALVFPADMEKEYPSLAREAKKLFHIREQRYASQMKAQSEQAEQRQQEINEIQARLTNLDEALKLSNEQISISEELLKEDLTNRYNHINLLREANTLKSHIEEDSAGLMRAGAALHEEQADLSGLRHNYREEASKQLEVSRRQLDELVEQMRKYADNLQRTVLVAPVNGVVQQLHVFTKGGVVKAGATVLEIIPTDDQLIVDGHLATQDIGYVRVGQRALIRLASAEAMRFDTLKGTVTSISPDSIIPESGDPYYKVRIVTDRDHFQRGGVRYKLFPGVQVTVNIQTGKRSVFSYLLDPFLRSLGGALQER